MKTISLTIDGRPVQVPEGTTTIFEAASRYLDPPIIIPALCHRPELGLKPVAVCRACAVDVSKASKPKPAAASPSDGAGPAPRTEGRQPHAPGAKPAAERRNEIAASCVRLCEEGMTVRTETPELHEMRKTLVEMLLAEHPRPCQRHKETLDCELELLGEAYGLIPGARSPEHPERLARQKNAPGVKFPSLVAEALPDDYGRLDTLFSPRAPLGKKDSGKPNIAVDHDACILCDRCVRACSDVAEFKIVGRTGKGAATSIGFDTDKPMDESACRNCGWCMVACPTGALTFRGDPRKSEPVTGVKVDLNLLLDDLSLFRKYKFSPEFLKRCAGGIVARQLNAGDAICEQGENGHTAFYIDQGSVNVFLRLVDSPKPKPRDRRHKRLHPGVIPLGAGITVSAEQPLAVLGEGAVLGENSCLNGTPRSATVRAAVNGTIIVEMTRNVLDMLCRHPEFKADLDAAYRRRAIHNHLWKTLASQGLVDKPRPELEKYLDSLADRVSLVRRAAGEQILRQGEPADAFYLIRLGNVKVSKRFGDGPDQPFNYLSQGKFFGEIELLDPDCLPPDMRDLAGTSLATCTALDNVELLRFGRDLFDEIVKQFPRVKAKLAETAKERFEFAEKQDPIRRGGGDPLLAEYLEKEIYQGQSLLVIDLDNCTRCDECVKACADAHNGVTRLIRDGLRFADKYLVTSSCRSCRDPKCLKGCPVDAIHRDVGRAIVIEDHCVGCGLCAEQCPYGNIRMHDVEWVDPQTREKHEGKRAMVCDLDNCKGEVQEPSCVHACPHDAAERVDGPTFFERLRAQSKVP